MSALVAKGVLSAALVTAALLGVASAHGAVTGPRADVDGHACAADCWVTFYWKGNGTGAVRVDSAVDGAMRCRPSAATGSCRLFVKDLGKVPVSAEPDPGSAFLGWEGCEEQDGTGACLLDPFRTDTLCAVFGAGSPASVQAGCPPTAPYAPQPPDSTPPNTRITSGPPRSTTRRRAAFRFSSTETGSVFVCRLDRHPWFPCASPKTYRRLKPGRHTFRVQAIDAVGNRDVTPAARTWRIRALTR